MSSAPSVAMRRAPAARAAGRPPRSVRAAAVMPTQRHMATGAKLLRPSSRSVLCRVSEDVDMEVQVEQFMKRQAELESGAAFARSRDTGEVLGGDVVSDEEATQMCAEIFEVMRTLKRTRDMSVAEVKLVVSIEDPRTRERRVVGDIEDERGVSRDEMAAALAEVAEGRKPRDRIALQCLHEEITNWPFLETTPADDGGAGAASSGAVEPSAYASELGGGDTVVKPYVMGEEARMGDKPKDLADMMPSWVGFGALYGISAIPVLLVVGCVLILFVNSLN